MMCDVAICYTGLIIIQKYHQKKWTDWKTCKYLGSLLDIEEDIRKALTTATCNKLKNILENKLTSIQTKIRILKVFIESAFLYNSELWTLTKLLEKEIDIFQRGVIKKIFNIHC